MANNQHPKMEMPSRGKRAFRSITNRGGEPLKVSSPRKGKNLAPEILIALLAKKWPACFSVYEKDRRPLQVGIHREVFSAEVASMGEIRLALEKYVANPSYLDGIKDGAVRIGLDGKPAGVVSRAQARHAAKERKTRFRKVRSKQPTQRLDGESPNAAKPRLTLRGRP
jgi:ProP effector